MAASVATYTANTFPKERLQYQNKIGLLGTIQLSSGTYPANGIPVSFVSKGVYTGNLPYWGQLYSPTTGIPYELDPVNQTVRIFQQSVAPNTVTTAAFTASANFGTSPTLALSTSSNQAAFSITVGAKASTGANPTLTYVFPQPYTQAPVVVISRGNDSNLTAGYWVTQDANTTNLQCVFQFVGTPTANDSYVLDAIVVDLGTNPSAAVAASNFALSSGWGTSAAPTITTAIPNSTQNAFSLTCTAGSAATTANPTVTLTFPVPYAVAPVFAVSDGVLRPTTGHWAFTGSTTTTASFIWIGTPTATDVYILDAIALNPNAPAVTASAFALSSGFGSTTAATVTGNEAAFVLTIPSSGSGQGANPTVTLTIPAALSGISTYVVSRADTDTNTGYWAVQDASSTTSTLIVKFVGTPVVSHTYGLSAVAQLITYGPTELATGATVPPIVVADTIYSNVTTVYS